MKLTRSAYARVEVTIRAAGTVVRILVFSLDAVQASIILILHVICITLTLLGNNCSFYFIVMYKRNDIFPIVIFPFLFFTSFFLSFFFCSGSLQQNKTTSPKLPSQTSGRILLSMSMSGITSMSQTNGALYVKKTRPNIKILYTLHKQPVSTQKYIEENLG